MQAPQLTTLAKQSKLVQNGQHVHGSMAFRMSHGLAAFTHLPISTGVACAKSKGTSSLLRCSLEIVTSVWAWMLPALASGNKMLKGHSTLDVGR